MKRTKNTLGWLVGAAALMLGMTACSNEDSMIEDEPTQQPTAATIRVTVGAGITDGEGATRSAVTKDGGTRTLKFTTGDKLYVVRNMADRRLAGELTMKGSPTNNGASATFEGTLKVYDSYGNEVSYSFGSGDPLTGSTATLLHKDMAEGLITLNTDHSLEYHQGVLTAAADVATLMTSGLLVQGGYTAGTGYSLSAASTTQPIVNCTIAGLQAGANYKVEYIYGTTAAMSAHSKTLSTGMTATGNRLSFAFFAGTGDKFHGIRLTNTADATDTYVASIGQKDFASKVYNFSRVWNGSEFISWSVVNLSEKSGGYTAQTGDILTGTMPSARLLYIEDGATVTLRDINVNCSDGYGIWCKGNANIILEGSNTVSSGISCGILIENGTLTIEGSGSLTVTGGNSQAGIGGADYGNVVIAGGKIIAQGDDDAAGIGGGKNSPFGNITITGGTVTAMGGIGGAGIGGGVKGSRGNITITGGTVTAMGGSGEMGGGAGIGGGEHGGFGNITFTGGYIEATGGYGSAGIGCGSNSSCGDITISHPANVTVMMGKDAKYCVGLSQATSQCGTVTINEIVFYNGSKFTDDDYEWILTNSPQEFY